MKKETIFELKALYRDNMRINAYTFGSGEKSCCIVAALRGNELQQVYTCSQIVKQLQILEAQGRIKPGRSVTVIPSANPYSMNIKKRFWATDNSDINRMFPGYDKGETTQRIAAGIFNYVKDYKYGIQFVSFYLPGRFIPHVRVMKTGYEGTDIAAEFGLPYTILREPRPYDTTTLNYNWQIWETKAFSLYTGRTSSIDKKSAETAVTAVMNFLAKRGVIEYSGHEGYITKIVDEDDLVNVRATAAGIMDTAVGVGTSVRRGDVLATVIDPCEGTVKAEIVSPVNGIVFFAQHSQLIYSSTVIYKIIASE